MKYEELERAVFARRARLAQSSPTGGPPPLAAVLAAIEVDQRTLRTKRAISRARRVVTAAVAVAACTAALFGAARALSPSYDRIVADRPDASAPDYGVRIGAAEPEEPSACMLDRTLVESRTEACTASPAPFASYAALEPSTCSIAGP